MSDLKLALIVLGALIIAGVLVYNWLQERKLRNEVSNDFIVPQKDVLADDFYIDTNAYLDKKLAGDGSKTIGNKTIASAQSNTGQMPKKPAIAEPVLAILDDNTLNAPSGHLKAYAAVETAENQAADDVFYQAKTLNESLPESPSESSIADAIVKTPLHGQTQGIVSNLPTAIHPQIDLTAILYATKNIDVNQMQALKTTIADIGISTVSQGSVMLHGLDSEDKWHLLSETMPSASFKQVACSLQLADRGGPIAKNLLNKFQYAVEDAGLNLNAHVEWQGSGDALQRAIELDQFCIEVDQMISVHMAQSDTPIHGTKFKGLAEASGLTLMADGKFHYLHNGKAEPLFVLIDTNNQPFTAENLRTKVLKSVTFQIEMPKVSNCEQVFNQMMIIAQKMAISLNARLVDDNQRLLGDLQIEKIRQQLKVIHATMVARGIMPGSPASMRLFS